MHNNLCMVWIAEEEERNYRKYSEKNTRCTSPCAGMHAVQAGRYIMGFRMIW